MDVPPGFESDATVNKGCRLKKSLYDLKQSPRAWFHRFTNVLKNKMDTFSANQTTLYLLSTQRRVRSQLLSCMWMILFLLAIMKRKQTG